MMNGMIDSNHLSAVQIAILNAVVLRILREISSCDDDPDLRALQKPMSAEIQRQLQLLIVGTLWVQTFVGLGDIVRSPFGIDFADSHEDIDVRTAS
ncbi:hypothetical protein HBI34_215890 [Parastagonospora nodorum]|nr:hypothetical protein HBI34_215890 [Parastagonospora nodorum]